MKETAMRKVIVSEFMSLDGVVQAPIYADEDASGGAHRGGARDVRPHHGLTSNA
jgi:hypothetical protein